MQVESICLFVFVMGWFFTSIYTSLYIVKNRKKISLVHYDPLHQFAQTICGSIALLATYFLEGFGGAETETETEFICQGWNIWMAFGAGKLVWMNLFLLLLVQRVVTWNKHVKKIWWLFFILVHIPVFIFFVIATATDSASKKNGVCVLNSEYETCIVVYFILEILILLAFSSRVTLEYEVNEFRTRPVLIVCCTLMLFLLPGVYHQFEFTFTLWWRILVIVLNAIPIIAWHSVATLTPAYLFAKHSRIFRESIERLHVHSEDEDGAGAGVDVDTEDRRVERGRRRRRRRRRKMRRSRRQTDDGDDDTTSITGTSETWEFIDFGSDGTANTPVQVIIHTSPPSRKHASATNFIPQTPWWSWKRVRAGDSKDSALAPLTQPRPSAEFVYTDWDIHGGVTTVREANGALSSDAPGITSGGETSTSEYYTPVHANYTIEDMLEKTNVYKRNTSTSATTTNNNSNDNEAMEYKNDHEEKNEKKKKSKGKEAKS